MRNSGRILKLQELIREAEILARQESRLQYNERRLTRLTAVLWVCRDVSDELVEEIFGPEPPDGRPERAH